ncbi:[FeFe] hydrogenase H-cluster radical SAM maturase HydE [Caldicellulosiruptor morganii]|uniref:[FeFe] hydrogenase H-cluster radical SAM maturase HydE n=1 Tax=Caldicellulosiruptor morganii TaxID=1387555 RepID=A0ABY7BRJ2_9FIRM|nr:[FeFe] hydrogenase H-cluster radical SAM maturase HydE [Caldicellulosiruptor morganii]WAM33721.1 [FeFe] hydrogenase H-cluster radical SAM maturase HydE [Caldicellulosiruptor morganii]
MNVKEILDKAYNTHKLSKDEIKLLLTLEGEERQLLFDLADRTRQKYVGDDVFLRGLIEFSSYCKNDCFYCGLRRSNTEAQRYRMQEEEIVEVARRAYEMGYRTVVLQSGEDPYYTRERMCSIIRKIKEEVDVAITLSIGERPYEDYKAFRQVGADRYLMRFETSNKELYQKLHPGMSFENRIECLKWIKSLGYELGTGFLIGLPGQTVDDLANDILLVCELDADMVGIGPFIPHPQTPLKDAHEGSVDITLKCIAILRLLLPDSNIPATTALGTLDPLGRQKGLKCGANIVMPNVNDLDYKLKYELYPGKICINEDATKCRGCIESIIISLGRRVGQGYGQSRHYRAKKASGD